MKNALTKITLILLTLCAGINLALAATTVPESITDLAVAANNRQVTLTWTAPYNGGAPINSYIVQYKTVASGAFESGTTCTGPNCQTCINASCTDTTPGAIIPGLTNWTDYQFRVFAVNTEGNSATSNVVNTIPSFCETLKNNDDSSGTSTVSDSCMGIIIYPGAISFEDVPESFSFPRKFSSTSTQHNFSNDNPTTSTIDVSTGPEDIMTIRDLRDTGGFDITITSTNFRSGSNTIPLENFYVATSYPDANDLAPDLEGTEVNGVEFSDGSTNTANLTSPVHSANATGTVASQGDLTNLINAYTTDGASFDADKDQTPDIITLITTGEERLGRISQALNFYINIPPDQQSGTYSVLLTIDLILF